MKITVEVAIDSDMNIVWESWNRPEDIVQWNAASDDWHTTTSSVDLREGGTFSSRMEAKDGSMGFDLSGTYTKVLDKKLIEYSLDDGRSVSVNFGSEDGMVTVSQTFEAETEMEPERQRQGWQSILDNFAKHVKSKQH